MTSIKRVCRNIVSFLLEDKEKSAITYCREKLDSDIDDEEYQEIKNKAISEREIWGNKCGMWMRVLAKASTVSKSEWRFVCANFLLSSVLSCRTSGDIVEDAVVSKASHLLFSKLDGAERYKKLSLMSYYHKRGHTERIKNGDDTEALSMFQKGLNIIRETDSLGGWHHHSLLLRDLANCEWQILRKRNRYVEARKKLEHYRSLMNNINSPKSSRFVSEIDCLLNFTKAKIADNLGKGERATKYIERCVDILIDIQDNTIERQIGGEIMNIYND